MKVNAQNHYRIEKDSSEDWTAFNDFLDRLLGDCTQHVNTEWLDWIQVKKLSNESDDAYLRRFNILKTQIRNEAQDLAKIEVMFFFAELDELMQCKIYKQSGMPDTKYNLVMLAKKLQPNLNRKTKSSLSMRFQFNFPFIIF